MPCVAPAGSSGRHACGWRLGDNGRQYHRQLQRHFVRGALFPCGWALGRCLVCGWVWWVGRCFWVGVKGEVCVCVCVCGDMGVDGMVSHMCLLIARGADIPGALRRARRRQREACLWMAAR